VNGLITDADILFRDNCNLEVVMVGQKKWVVDGVEVEAYTPDGAIAQYERTVGWDMDLSGGKTPFYLKKIRRVR